MSKSFRSRSGGGTSIKTYVILTIVCVAAVLIIQGIVALTRTAKEGLEDAAAGAVQKAVQAEVAKAARGARP